MNEGLTLDRDEQRIVLTALLSATYPIATKTKEKLAQFQRGDLINRLERNLDRRKSRVKKEDAGKTAREIYEERFGKEMRTSLVEELREVGTSM